MSADEKRRLAGGGKIHERRIPRQVIRCAGRKRTKADRKRERSHRQDRGECGKGQLFAHGVSHRVRGLSRIH